MKDYYLILGIGRSASDREIKRVYRRLAIKFHPDKNRSGDAEATFKEINEAYEVLSDPESRATYDQRLDNPFSSTAIQPEQTHRDPAYQRRWGAPRQSVPSERTLFMHSMLKYSQLLFYFGCLWCAVLVVDYILPTAVKHEVVITDIKRLSRLISRENLDLLVTDRGHHFPVMIDEMRYFPTNSSLHIHKSRLMSALVRVENHDGTYVVNNLATIYRNFFFAPVLLLLVCMIGLVIRRGVEFHVNLGIVVFLLMILNLVFLFTSRI